jgi:hypothetical protein
MSGWSSAESRIRNLGKKSQLVEQGNRVSVVYFHKVDGERVIDWPKNPASGVLLVPCPLTIEQWVEKHGRNVV